jgi:hypothetical protein
MVLETCQGQFCSIDSVMPQVIWRLCRGVLCSGNCPRLGVDGGQDGQDGQVLMMCSRCAREAEDVVVRIVCSRCACGLL